MEKKKYLLIIDRAQEDKEYWFEELTDGEVCQKYLRMVDDVVTDGVGLGHRIPKDMLPVFKSSLVEDKLFFEVSWTGGQETCYCIDWQFLINLEENLELVDLEKLNPVVNRESTGWMNEDQLYQVHCILEAYGLVD